MMFVSYLTTFFTFHGTLCSNLGFKTMFQLLKDIIELLSKKHE
jgi:hypothetical protein